MTHTPPVVPLPAPDTQNRVPSTVAAPRMLSPLKLVLAVNDVVVSTKLLDYLAAGLPTIATRTATQVEILGSQYPLFVDDPGEVLERARAVLADPSLYRTAAETAWQVGRAYTYERVYDGIRPHVAAALALAGGG